MSDLIGFSPIPGGSNPSPFVSGFVAAGLNFFFLKSFQIRRGILQVPCFFVLALFLARLLGVLGFLQVLVGGCRVCPTDPHIFSSRPCPVPNRSLLLGGQCGPPRFRLFLYPQKSFQPSPARQLAINDIRKTRRKLRFRKKNPFRKSLETTKTP